MQSVYNPPQGAVPKWLREQSAKLRCIGSNPIGDSKQSLRDRELRSISLGKNVDRLKPGENPVFFREAHVEGNFAALRRAFRQEIPLGSSRIEHVKPKHIVAVSLESVHGVNSLLIHAIKQVALFEKLHCPVAIGFPRLKNPRNGDVS